MKEGSSSAVPVGNAGSASQGASESEGQILHCLDQGQQSLLKVDPKKP